MDAAVLIDEILPEILKETDLSFFSLELEKNSS